MRAMHPSVLPDNKRVYVEFLGGDLDGLTIDSNSTDSSEQLLLEMSLGGTEGGQVGKAFHGYSAGAIQRIARHGGNNLKNKSPGTGTHQYTVTERLAHGDEILIRLKHSVRLPKRKTDSTDNPA